MMRPSRLRNLLLPLLALLAAPLAGSTALAQMQHGMGEAEDLYPDPVTYDASIPTLQEVVGHDWGQKITSPDEVGRYLQALADASDRIELFEYATSWEGRPLRYLAVATPENLARLDEIREANLALTDPRVTSQQQAEAIIGDNPIVSWLAYGVHGNEISSTDAALRTLYQLAAATDDPVTDEILANSVVLIDPMQNPDGRNRFVNFYRQSRGRWPNAHGDSVEQSEPWPGGRTNHYLFDLNRDWFAQTQPETRGKVAAFMHWRPQVYVDLHEMGGNSSYYFPPQADPRNPNQSDDIAKWIEAVGENNGRWFDRLGFAYFNREIYDSFYPGYGASWPMYQGALGMTYEQASSRGLLYSRSDETVLVYRDTVHHHFIASISTLEAAADNREGILADFWKFHQDAIEQGAQDDIREIVLVPGDDPGRTDKLVRILMSQGVEVSRASEPFANVVSDYYGSEPGRREFPAGSYRISMSQPSRFLVKSLLAPETPMADDFMQEQRRRYMRREGDQIYDITGWSLPLLFDLDAAIASEPSTSEEALARDRLADAPAATTGAVHGGQATVAYLVPWGTQKAVEGLAALQMHDIRVHSAGDSFTLGGRTYPPGSLVIRVAENDEGLHGQLEMIARHHGVDFFATNTSWVEDGISLGSGRVRYLPKPKVAIAWDSPTSSYSAGWARFLLESPYHTPTTVVRTEQLASADLDDFNVIVLPDAGFFGGGYGGAFGDRGLDRLRSWVSDGGTLVTLGGATLWATSEDVGLLSTARKLKENDPDADPTVIEDGIETGLPANVLPEEELPTPLPGAILRAQLDTNHWLAFGYDPLINLIAQSRNIYEPLTIDEGLNIATYLPADEGLLVSGVAWPDELALIAGTPFLMYQQRGGGHVVAFAEDPNFRAYFDGLNLLFLNAVHLGPGY